MTIAYSINGGAEIHGVQSSWKRVPQRVNWDSTIDYSDWAINNWEIPVIGLTNFETLRAAQGQTLTSLESNDIDTINSAKIYDTAILEGVINGGHLALQVHSVKATFRVRISDRRLLETGDFRLLETGDKRLLE
jgi:hypothetical protein